ncbi:MAG: chorismate mutase [Desulfovibrionaceae bacterium]
MMEEAKSTVDILRRRIEELDSEIASKIKNRFDIVKKVKEYKEHTASMVLDPYREATLFSIIEVHSELEKSYIHNFWKEIFSYSKEIQGFICYIVEDTLCTRALVKMLLGASTKIEKYSKEKKLSNKNALFIQSGADILEFFQEKDFVKCVEYTIFYGEERNKENYSLYIKKECKECLLYSVYI